MFKFIYQTAILVIIVVVIAAALKLFSNESAEAMAESVKVLEEKCQQGDKEACTEAENTKTKAKNELTAEEYIIYMTKLGMAVDSE